MGKGGPTKNGMIFKIPLCGYDYVNKFCEIWTLIVKRYRGDGIWFIEIVYYFYPAFPKPLKTPLAKVPLVPQIP